MLSLLLKPLIGVASNAVSGYIETKKAKTELKLTTIKATQKLKEDQISLQQPNLIPKLIQTMSWRARLGQNMHELCVVLCNTGKNSDGAR